MTTLEGLLDDFVADPDPALWLILTDWLEEHDDSRKAELLRLHRQLIATCCEPDQHPRRSAWQSRIVYLLEQGVSPCGPRRSISISEGVEMTFVWIPPGSFLMGSPPDEVDRDEDELLHRVTQTEGFWLGMTPVTQAQWQAVLGNNPSHFHGEANLPVEQASWQDSQEFCDELSRRAGGRYRLPTEAEWEYACRAGTTTPFFFGETISTEQVNYDGNYVYPGGRQGTFRKRTTPVGSLPANGWGLYDLHGNVFEWCSDPWRSYAQEDTIEPLRVLRGGSWRHNPWCCRAAYRDSTGPRFRTDFIGCRLILTPD